MKKAGILMLVVLISLGIIVVMGGCGGGGSSSLPKSSPSYAGSNLPAVIDTTTAENFFPVPWDIGMLVDSIAFNEVLDSDEGTVEGLYGGTAHWWWKEEGWSSSTSESFKDTMGYEFDNYWDDGSSYKGLLRGDGSAYMEEYGKITSSGGESMAAIILDPGQTLTELNHQNFSSFYFSDLSDEEERSGWMTMESFIENVGGDMLWNVDFGANIAMADLEDEYYLALLNAEAGLAWDGSFTTYSGQGTICVEGNAEYDVLGCCDVSFDMRWDVDGEGGPVSVEDAYPIDGWTEVSTMSASALFSYGSSPSDPTCYTLEVDADGDEVYEWSDEICEPI